MRYKITIAVFLLFWGVMIARLYHVSIKSNFYYEELAKDNIERKHFIKPVRGEISDVNGKLLAMNQIGFSISIKPHLKQKDHQLEKIVDVLVETFPDLNKSVMMKVYKKHSSPYNHNFIKVVDFIHYNDMMGAYPQLSLHDEIQIEAETKRYYPYGKYAAHIVGYTGRSNKKENRKDPVVNVVGKVGKSGLERYYNKVLQGELGYEINKVTATNKAIELLERKLHESVEDLVNRVGVDVNSASASLLSFVAGVGPKLARSIVQHREEHGAFRSKKELLKVKGLGAKAYEQSAGFIRIRDGKSLFDNTGIHPESYDAAEALQQIKEKIDTKSLAEKLGVGEETLKDIIKELDKPGFDPREELPAIPFKDDMTDINMLREGSIVSGVVRNIADFGAFVDIGLKNDGMIHISEMSEKRIKHPLEVLSVNQYLHQIEVISVDVEKGKVGLSLKGIDSGY